MRRTGTLRTSSSKTLVDYEVFEDVNTDLPGLVDEVYGRPDCTPRFNSSTTSIGHPR